MLTLVQKVVRKEGRGEKAPALLAFPNLLLQRFGRATRGQAFACARYRGGQRTARATLARGHRGMGGYGLGGFCDRSGRVCVGFDGGVTNFRAGVLIGAPAFLFLYRSHRWAL